MKFFVKYTKMFVSVILVFAVQLVYGAFTGNNLSDNNKFSLKNLNISGKNYTLNSLRAGTFRYKGSSDLYQQNNGSQINVQSMIRLEKGNTTYVYPYKYTVKVPKFKTPVAPIVR